MSSVGREALDISTVFRHLWPPAFDDVTTFALLDCARDRRIESVLRASDLHYDCLLSGDLTPSLRSAAPYIVRLEPASDLTEILLTEGWGNAWGVFALDWRRANLSRMRRHFRQFLKARDESGRRFLFRFYDPRVLRLYLPTCTSEEARTFFGPAAMFIMEGDSPERLLAYSLASGGVEVAEVDLRPAASSS
jgi:hypothetical protein